MMHLIREFKNMLSWQPPPVGRVGKTGVAKQKRLSRKASNRARRA